MPQQFLALLMLFLSLGGSVLGSFEEQFNLGGCLFLVNRDYRIGSSYEPEDLVMPEVARTTDSVLLRREAAEALEVMFAAAQEDGIELMAVSGYRSYSTQSAIHDRKIQTVGKKNALRVSAPPGASEHQLGLAMDLCTPEDHGLTERFAQTPQGQWIRENAADYGFIIRYRADWEEITGYMDEPWHIRYVGPYHAGMITALDMPLETYTEMLKIRLLQRLAGEEP